MSLYGVGETYTNGFGTYSASNALANADSLPTGILVVNGIDTGVAVTITNLTAGRYSVSVPLTGRTVGDECHVRVSATVGGITQEWRSPPFRIAFPAALSGGVLTAGLGTAQVTTTNGKISLNLSQIGLSPRALDAVADAAITVGDCLVAAVSGTAGKETVTGTTYQVKTPSTGTVIRTFILNSSSAPTSRA